MKPPPQKNPTSIPKCTIIHIKMDHALKCVL